MAADSFKWRHEEFSVVLLHFLSCHAATLYGELHVALHVCLQCVFELQEASASFDLRASHGLSSDPMPIRDEENR